MTPLPWARVVGAVAVVVALSACGPTGEVAGTSGGDEGRPNQISGRAPHDRDEDGRRQDGTAEGGGNDASGHPDIAVTVTGGSVSGTPGTEAVSVGEEVTISVRSDEADEVHVHVYDLKDEVAPGEPATLTFVADVPGVFEVELERSGTLLFELEVR